MSLTNRQLQIAREVAKGKPNCQIAKEFNIAENTVSTHVSMILAALRLSNRGQIRNALKRMDDGEVEVQLSDGVVVSKNITAATSQFLVSQYAFTQDEVKEFYRKFLDVAMLATINVR